MRRWIIVHKTSGKPTKSRVSYPSEWLCGRFCGPDEAPLAVEVAGPSGPFSDFLAAPSEVPHG